MIFFSSNVSHKRQRVYRQEPKESKENCSLSDSWFSNVKGGKKDSIVYDVRSFRRQSRLFFFCKSDFGIKKASLKLK